MEFKQTGQVEKVIQVKTPMRPIPRIFADVDGGAHETEAVR